MTEKRITLFAGHYGSGKTTLAVNWALHLRRSHPRVAIADIDIVNPYFRTKDSAAELEAAGIRLISSAYANSNVDLPALPAGLYAMVDDRSTYMVADIGGDDRGALALGRYADRILAENDYEMLLVINRFRPLTRDGGSTVAVMHEIEQAAGLRFTAIANGSNLGAETTPEDVLGSVAYAEEIAAETGLPVKLTAAAEPIAAALAGRIDNLFPVRLFGKPGWSI